MTNQPQQPTNKITPWETQETTTKYTGFNFEVIEDTTILPSGDTIPFEYVSVPHAVAVIAVTPDNKMILVSEWRQTVERTVDYSLPGGAVNNSETPQAAAKRELREETGYEPESLTQLITTENNLGVSDGTHTFFIAQNCEQVTEPDTSDPTEQTKTHTKPVSEVLHAANTGEITDARTLLPLQHYQATVLED